MTATEISLLVFYIHIAIGSVHVGVYAFKTRKRVPITQFFDVLVIIALWPLVDVIWIWSSVTRFIKNMYYEEAGINFCEGCGTKIDQGHITCGSTECE